MKNSIKKFLYRRTTEVFFVGYVHSARISPFWCVKNTDRSFTQEGGRRFLKSLFIVSEDFEEVKRDLLSALAYELATAKKYLTYLPNERELWTGRVETLESQIQRIEALELPDVMADMPPRPKLSAYIDINKVKKFKQLRAERGQLQ